MLSTRPLKMVNAAPDAPEHRLGKLRVVRVQAEPANETTEAPIHTATAAANTMVAKPWLERLAMVEHSTATSERYRCDASYRVVVRWRETRPLSVTRHEYGRVHTS